jgi:nicotinamidase-related amidase
MSTAKSREFGHLDPANTALLICDLQERVEASIRHFWTIVKNTERLVKTAALLQVPIIATEQYPKVIMCDIKNSHS